MSASIASEFTLASDPKTVFEMLVNPEFLKTKVALAKSGDFEVSGSAPKYVVKVNREVEADFPPIVRKFVGDILIVKETQIWQKDSESHYSAKFELIIPGAAVQISGEIAVFGKATTTVKLTGLVKVNVPIFGAAAEPHVVNEIDKVLADEETICNAWINK